MSVQSIENELRSSVPSNTTSMKINHLISHLERPMNIKEIERCCKAAGFADKTFQSNEPRDEWDRMVKQWFNARINRILAIRRFERTYFPKLQE